MASFAGVAGAAAFLELIFVGVIVVFFDFVVVVVVVDDDKLFRYVTASMDGVFIQFFRVCNCCWVDRATTRVNEWVDCFVGKFWF